MKRARIINAAIWAVVAITLTTCVCLQWAAQGADALSLGMAVVFYNLFPGLLCALVDDKIRRANK